MGPIPAASSAIRAGAAAFSPTGSATPTPNASFQPSSSTPNTAAHASSAGPDIAVSGSASPLTLKAKLSAASLTLAARPFVPSALKSTPTATGAGAKNGSAGVGGGGGGGSRGPASHQGRGRPSGPNTSTSAASTSLISSSPTAPSDTPAAVRASNSLNSGANSSALLLTTSEWQGLLAPPGPRLWGPALPQGPPHSPGVEGAAAAARQCPGHLRVCMGQLPLLHPMGWHGQRWPWGAPWVRQGWGWGRMEACAQEVTAPGAGRGVRGGCLGLVGACPGGWGCRGRGERWR
ncbi:hypothetical protein V8C86DRAFT_1388990 [Haematococcus lacustris]